MLTVTGCGLALLFAPIFIGTLAASPASASHNMQIFATGLNNPRGLQFGPDGSLYVAEARLAGSQTTSIGQCLQVPAPVGPYAGGLTGRISRLDEDGNRHTVADRLPSSRNAVGDTLALRTSHLSANACMH